MISVALFGTGWPSWIWPSWSLMTYADDEMFVQSPCPRGWPVLPVAHWKYAPLYVTNGPAVYAVVLDHAMADERRLRP